MTPDEIREATANDLLRLWKLGDEIMAAYGIPAQRAVTRTEQLLRNCEESTCQTTR